MEQIKAFFENDYALFYFFATLMILYQIILWKQHKFYNFSREMDRHPLSSKYHLNRGRSADLYRINRFLALSNIFAIVGGCIVVTLISFQAGIVSLAVLFVLFNQISTTYLGKYYSPQK